MIYNYAANDNYAYLAAGAVIKSYKGNTNFPVRLGHEIFNRCLAHINPKEKVSIYDPMCGSGYLLTTISILNFNKISKIYASDVNREVLLVAEKNLRLLTRSGIQHRENEIQASLEKFNRPSYKQSLEHIKVFKDTVDNDIAYSIFKRDVFSDNEDLDLKAEIVIMDLPYSSLAKYEGNYSPKALEKQILNFTKKHLATAVIANKNQKLSVGLRQYRKEKFKVGNRVIEIYKNK